MICVSIGRGRHKHMIAEHRHLVEQGARLVELRMDFIRRTVNLRRLLGERPCPVIVTCRRPQDGGRWEGTEEQRLMLLRSAIAAGVEYVDLEDDIATAIPRFGKTQRIVSAHNFRETPSDLEGMHTRMAAADADIVKIATMAHHPSDNVRMLRLIRDSNVPTVGMCMGDIGTPSRILAGRFGAPFTYATFHQERSMAPGQLSYRQMMDVYRYDELSPETAVYGVIADPVGHSLSPVIHNAAFRVKKMNSVYLPFRVPRESLPAFLADSQELGLRGLSVTIPLKEEIIPLLSRLDAAAKGIGAVNTVVFEGDERVGYNTDCDAAMYSLAKGFGKRDESDWLRGRTVLLLGAGGAAKAIGYGLRQRGGRVVIASRTHERAAELARGLECDAVVWEKRHGVRAQAIVNATPVGMHPNVDESPYDQTAFKTETVVFDTVYNPERTLLVKEAREAGCRVVTGVDMFVRQAALQFQLFTGEKAPRDVMRSEVKRATGAAKR